MIFSCRRLVITSPTHESISLGSSFRSRRKQTVPSSPGGESGGRATRAECASRRIFFSRPSRAARQPPGAVTVGDSGWGWWRFPYLVGAARAEWGGRVGAPEEADGGSTTRNHPPCARLAQPAPLLLGRPVGFSTSSPALTFSDLLAGFGLCTLFSQHSPSLPLSLLPRCCSLPCCFDQN